MTRTYAVAADNITLANQPVSLISIRPPAAMAVEVVEARVAFHGTATSTQQRVQLITQVVSGSPAMTGATPTPLDLGNTQASAIASGTAQGAGEAGINASTESSGAKTVKVADAFNWLTGWIWVAPPDGGIILPAGFASAFNIFFPAAPTTLTGWHATLTYKEL